MIAKSLRRLYQKQLKKVITFFQDRVYRNLSIATGITLSVGTIVFHFVEKFSWIDAFYFSATTLTTVGYGDLAPKTDFGKIFTVIYIFVGIGIIFGFINAVQEHQKKHIMNYYYDDYEN